MDELFQALEALGGPGWPSKIPMLPREEMVKEVSISRFALVVGISGISHISQPSIHVSQACQVYTSMQAPPPYLLLQSKRYLQLACKGFEAHIQAPCSGAGPCTSVWQKGDVAYRQVQCVCVCVCVFAHDTVRRCVFACFNTPHHAMPWHMRLALHHEPFST